MFRSGEDPAALKERVAAYGSPILSAYLGVNPADPKNVSKAYLIRLKGAMKDARVPERLSRRVLERVDAEQPRARTLALFVSLDGPFEVHRLHVDLPERTCWGDPYVVPLILAAQQHEPYGVVLLDAEKARLFVSDFGRMEEELDAENIFSTAGWREATISPSTAAPSGGIAKDVYEHRVEAQTLHFYKTLGETVRDLIERFGLTRLILAGTEERTSAFAGTLSRQTAEMVAASVPLPLGASETEVMRKVSEAEEGAQQKRHEELLATAREEGTTGLDETLGSLYEGRVHHLLVPWSLGEQVGWCDVCGLATTAAGNCPYCGRPTRVRELIDAVLELAEARGTRVEFLLGVPADRLRGEFSGLAGLVRF